MQKIKSKPLKDYTFIDLFAGIGGFHLALSSFGAKCVFASDIDKNAIEVYEDNFKMKVSGDITKIDIKVIPNHDIICAGFPCQAFSISGQKKGFDDPRGKLYKSVVKIASHHKPQIILLENVKNLEAHNEGKTLQKIKKDFDKIGYKLVSKVLNASNYGVPQARQRIYLVAFRNDLNIQNFEFPNGSNKLVSLSDILENYTDEQYNVNREFVIKIPEEKIEKKNLLIRIGSIGKGRQGERIYSIKGHSSTLSSSGGGLGGKTGMYIINNKLRRLTPRECARAMGFPDSFRLAKTVSMSYSQFGNSVVVDVLQEIIKQIIKSLEENENDKK